MGRDLQKIILHFSDLPAEKRRISHKKKNGKKNFFFPNSIKKKCIPIRYTCKLNVVLKR